MLSPDAINNIPENSAVIKVKHFPFPLKIGGNSQHTIRLIVERIMTLDGIATSDDDAVSECEIMSEDSAMLKVFDLNTTGFEYLQRKFNIIL